MERYSLLRVESDNERRNVDDLLANSDVPLPDKDTGVVNRLGKTIIGENHHQPHTLIPGGLLETHPSLNT